MGWDFPIEAVGLMARRKITGLPLEMPPKIPPLWLVVVSTFPLAQCMQSLAAEPFIAARPKPSPNSMPFTAGMENIMWDSSLSSESKKGSPRPAGRPVTMHSTMPPTESPSALASRMASSIFSPTSLVRTGSFSLRREAKVSSLSPKGSKRRSSIPAMRVTCAPMWMPLAESTCRAMEPAKVKGAVMRPEKCPPPR